ncbi:putative laccase [Medicago truncatula]|uniref:Putative laccase n=1 Tax=Medicago truncatula TaxID=3880 RepID=A0A396IL46_MEDTR|nr:putative laccase [Medicago truncatula]
MNKAAVAFGSFRIWSRAHIQIPVPFPPSAGDFTILAGDWFKLGHRRLRRVLENGHNLPFPDCLLINGRGWNGNTFTVNQGKTYGFRISNVGLAASINFIIQGHSLKLVEVEGSHTLQNTYSSLDIHIGQSYSVLVTANQSVKDYYAVVSTLFTRWNLTASGPRPNPQ